MHHEQKQSSRESLLRSANYLFVHHSYSATTIDDIVKRANVSRATFYRHFDDKWAISNEIFGQLDSIFLGLYDDLAKYDNPTEAEISDWLNRLLEILKAHKPLVRAMREADTIERESDNTPTIMHEALISRLAKRISAFRLATCATESGLEARVGAHLLMLQFDEFCYAVAVRGSIDQTIGVRVMARLFRRFIEEYPHPPEATQTI
jgi:AcrR family transcriptional regulator